MNRYLKRYNFDRTTTSGQLAAGGIAVHAISLGAARRKARRLLRPGERLLEFRDHSPCLGRCEVCRVVIVVIYHALTVLISPTATTIMNQKKCQMI